MTASAVAYEYALEWLREAANVPADRTRKLKACEPLQARVELALAEHWTREGTILLRHITPAWWRGFAGVTEAAGDLKFDINMSFKEILAALQADPATAYNQKTTTATIQGAAVEAMKAGHGSTMMDAAKDNPAVIGVFNVKHPIAVKYLADHGAERVTGIDDSTRKYVRIILRKGVEGGSSYQEIAKHLISLEAGFAAPSPLGHIRSRAELIAVTEIGDAYVAGTLAAADELEQAGLAMEKHWLTVGDSRVDDAICRTNEGQGWIPLKKSFASGHDGPTGHPGCRCDLQTRHSKTLPKKLPPPKPIPTKTSAEVAHELILDGKLGPKAIADQLNAQYPGEDWTGLKVTHAKQKLQKQGAVAHTPKPRAPKPVPAPAAPPPPAAQLGRFRPEVDLASRDRAFAALGSKGKGLPLDVTPDKAKEQVAAAISKRLQGNPIWDAYTKANPASGYRGDPHVGTLIHQWASTSADSNPRAIAMQLAAHEEFGLSASSRAAMWDHLAPGLKGHVTSDLTKNGPAYRVFLRAMYDDTQARFKAEGITELTLMRGQALTDTHTPSWVRDAFGDKIEFNAEGKVTRVSTAGEARISPHLRPLSSFTPDLPTAQRFSTMLAEGEVKGTVIAAGTIPVESILSSARTGFGCLNEWEFVVLDSPGELRLSLRPR